MSETIKLNLRMPHFEVEKGSILYRRNGGGIGLKVAGLNDGLQDDFIRSVHETWDKAMDQFDKDMWVFFKHFDNEAPL